MNVTSDTVHLEVGHVAPQGTSVVPYATSFMGKVGAKSHFSGSLKKTKQGFNWQEIPHRRVTRVAMSPRV